MQQPSPAEDRAHDAAPMAAPGPSARRVLERLAQASPVPADERDAAIRASIARHFEWERGRSAQPVLTIPLSRRVRAWIGLAATIAIVTSLSLLPVGRVDRHGSTRSAPIAPVKLATALAEAERVARSMGPVGAANDPRVVALLAAVVSMPGAGDRQVATAGQRFATFDLIVDGLEADVAAWQVELRLPGAVVGIEGGDPPFRHPAAYDPAALVTGRLIVAGLPDPMPRAAAARAPRTAIRLASVTVWLGAAGADPAIVESMLLASGGSPAVGSLRLEPRNSDWQVPPEEAP